MNTGTLNFKGVELEIEYHYEAEEPEVKYYGDGSGYPGYPEVFEIQKITLAGVDVTELLESDFEQIEEDFIKQSKDNY